MVDKLIHIQVESSTICNGRCTFCPRFDMRRDGGSMSDELFYKIVREAKEMGVTTISPFLNGEPFLFDRLFSWLDYLNEMQICSTIFTNASVFSKDKANKINDYPLVKLVFSLHGYDKQSYESQTSLSYDLVVENIKYYTTIAKVPYHIYILDTGINHNGISTFLETWQDFNPYFAKMNNWAGKRPSSMEGTVIPCERILSEMTIYWDGRVNLCCMDSDAGVILGDVNSQSIKEIWEGNQWMRDNHHNSNFDLPLCRNCNKNMV